MLGQYTSNTGCLDDPTLSTISRDEKSGPLGSSMRDSRELVISSLSKKFELSMFSKAKEFIGGVVRGVVGGS